MLDIIVPIHNGWPWILRCLESVFRHTDPCHRILLIDDESTDPRVGAYLRLLEQHGRCTVIRNERQMGFSASANRGMQLSRRDVILLNSDAIVTRGWAEKLQSCAASSAKVGTVTPLSNHGTIAGIPVWLGPPELLFRAKIDELAEQVEKSSQRCYPMLPVGVGFLLFICREALDAVGYFDETTFSPGYGEEVDFCLRARRLGFVHLLDDATFVYHHGRVSFGSRAQILRQRHREVILERYPHFTEDRMKSKAGPLLEVRDHLRSALWQNRKRETCILYVLHKPIYPHLSLGGLQFHATDLVQSLRGIRPLVAYPAGNTLHVYDFRPWAEPRGYLFPLKEDPWKQVLQEFKVDVVHVLHLLGHSFELPRVAKERNIPVILDVCDYYLYCPNYNLIDYRGRFCHFCRDEERCDRCLEQTRGSPHSEARRWRKAVSEEILPYVDRLVFPSDNTRRAFANLFAHQEERARTIPPGLSSFPHLLPCRSMAVQEEKALRVAFIGPLYRAKGALWLQSVMMQPRPERIEMHFFGPDAPDFDPCRLHPTWSGHVHFHGPYQRDELPALLRLEAIDVALLLSIGPETYCRTLDEVWSAGVPVIASSLGALGDRVRTHSGGYLLEPHDTEGVIRLWNHLADHLEELEERRREIERIPLPRTEETMGEYRNLYDELLAKPQREPRKRRGLLSLFRKA